MLCYRLSEFSEPAHKASLLRSVHRFSIHLTSASVISRCYLALGNLAFSLEFAAQAYAIEPRNVLSSYLLFTIFVEQKNVTEGTLPWTMSILTEKSVQGLAAIRQLRL
jgi:hypothetical protein